MAPRCVQRDHTGSTHTLPLTLAQSTRYNFVLFEGLQSFYETGLARPSCTACRNPLLLIAQVRQRLREGTPPLVLSTAFSCIDAGDSTCGACRCTHRLTEIGRFTCTRATLQAVNGRIGALASGDNMCSSCLFLKRDALIP